jgi:hypothetical protein
MFFAQAINWPHGLFYLSVTSLLFSPLLSWLLRRVRRPRWLCITFAGLGIVFWLLYEIRLSQVAPVGDPLIRMDLLVLVPLVLINGANILYLLVRSA